MHLSAWVSRRQFNGLRRCFDTVEEKSWFKAKTKDYIAESDDQSAIIQNLNIADPIPELALFNNIL